LIATGASKQLVAESPAAPARVVKRMEREQRTKAKNAAWREVEVVA
jgi:hypothetical protein